MGGFFNNMFVEIVLVIIAVLTVKESITNLFMSYEKRYAELEEVKDTLKVSEKGFPMYIILFVVAMSLFFILGSCSIILNIVPFFGNKMVVGGIIVVKLINIFMEQMHLQGLQYSYVNYINDKLHFSFNLVLGTMFGCMIIYKMIVIDFCSK